MMLYRATKRYRLSLGFIWLLFLGGCYYTALQTPYVLPPGKVTLGVEATVERYVTPGNWVPVPGYTAGDIGIGIGSRVGVVKNTDVGLRLTLHGGLADVKYQFLHGPIAGAFDAGVSYLPPTDIGGGWNYDVEHFLGVYPMLLFGTEHYYGGARFAYVLQYSSSGVGRFVMPGILVGASFGRKWRIQPEANCYYSLVSQSYWRVAFGGGLGFRYQF